MKADLSGKGRVGCLAGVTKAPDTVEFVWRRIRAGWYLTPPRPEKWHPPINDVHGWKIAENAQALKNGDAPLIIKRVKLTQRESELSLDALAAEYPCPDLPA